MSSEYIKNIKNRFFFDSALVQAEKLRNTEMLGHRDIIYRPDIHCEAFDTWFNKEAAELQSATVTNEAEEAALHNKRVESNFGIFKDHILKAMIAKKNQIYLDVKNFSEDEIIYLAKKIRRNNMRVEVKELGKKFFRVWIIWS